MKCFTYDGYRSNGYKTRYSLFIELNENESVISDGRIAKDGIDYIERNVFIYNKNEQGESVAFSKCDLEFISGWLFTKGYKFLNVEDRNYLGMFIKKHGIWYRDAKDGFIELIFRLKPFKYSNILVETLGVNNTTYSRKIHLKSDVDTELYPTIIIENMSREFLNISIENKTIKGNKLTFNGLIPVDRALIDCDEKYMKSYIDVSEDLYSKSNLIYLRLCNGENIVEVKGSKRAKVNIEYRDRYMLKEGDFFWVKE